MKKLLKIVGFVFLALFAVMAIAVYAIAQGTVEGTKVVVGDIDLTEVTDGTYTGEYAFKRWTNTLNVTVSDHKITKIEIEKNVQFYNQELSDQVFADVIANQSLDIDIQSGATVTSKAYLKAIEDAVGGN